MNRPNWTHLVYLFAIVGFSLLSWIIKRWQQQMQLKRVRDAQEKRELETLRTGRDPGLEPAAPPMRPGPGASAADAEARREAQLRELRRRAAMRGQAGAQGGGRAPVVFVPPQTAGRGGGGMRGPIVIIPGSPGPIVPQRGRGAPPTRPMAPAAQRASGMAPLPVPKPNRGRGQGRGAERRPSVAPARVEEPTEAHTSMADMTKASEAEAARREVVVARTPRLGLSAADMRRAIVMREILDPPLSERGGGGEAGV